ncbi:MAG: hypothetical protein RIS44_432 [Pseudomonadota bacterium]|jgi:hypothetical protein
MRKLWLPIILMLAAFLAGVAVAANGYWFQPIVTLSVVNNSGQKIESLVVTYAGGAEGSLLIRDRKPGQRTVIRFFQGGDGSFNLSTTLADGKTLKSVGSYVQPGYSFAIDIGSDSVNLKQTSAFNLR